CGPLKLLCWQAPTLINPYFAICSKDQYASRHFYAPLAAWDPDGNLLPMLGASVPSKDGPDVLSVEEGFIGRCCE
ncbi:hypothetical protein CCS92_34955, partial [Methylobacterium radiotolerans]